MKMPERPPVWSHEQVAAALEVLGRRPGQLVHDEYAHWDKLRHLKPPARLSHEQWWALIKMARSSDRQTIKLVDADGVEFSYINPNFVQKSLHKIDLNAGGMIQMPDPLLNREQADRYIVRSLIEEAITSSQIEGAATTRRVAKQMIRSGRPPRDRGELMIVNNYRAMRLIKEWGKATDLSAERLLELHEVLCEGTFDRPDEIGRFRRSDERIRVEDAYGDVRHTPPPADELSRRVDVMCEFANGGDDGPFVHPVIRSIILHFWLAYDHPFTDGNGRCARALFYWSMLRHGYWLAEFLSISEVIKSAHARYGRAFLYTETDENDLTYFIVYHIELIEKAMAKIHEYVRRKTREQRRTEALIRSHVHLNHRQKALLSHALRHPDARYTIQSHQTSHDVVYESARQDLLGLVERNLLNKQKAGKAWVFEPVSELEAVLATG